jgi:hypothetical protein
MVEMDAAPDPDPYLQAMDADPDPDLSSVVNQARWIWSPCSGSSSLAVAFEESI